MGLGAALAVVSVGCAAWVRPRIFRWGATDDEVRMPLPGYGSSRKLPPVMTHAITIQAPPDRVWPWLVQIGYRRAGFYSHDLLENLSIGPMVLAGRFRSLDRIVPSLQHLKVGDRVPLSPVTSLGVTALEAGRYLILGSDWVFFLQPLPGEATRLIVRWHGITESNPVAVLYNRLFLEPAHFIMQTGMMRGIRERAEGIYQRAASR